MREARCARMRPMRRAFLLLALLPGCSCADDCDGALCELCPNAITLEIVVPGGAMPTVTGTPELDCITDTSMTHCSARYADPGTYTYEVSAPGRAPQTISLTVGESTETGCCACAVDAANERISFE